MLLWVVWLWFLFSYELILERRILAWLLMEMERMAKKFLTKEKVLLGAYVLVMVVVGAGYGLYRINARDNNLNLFLPQLQAVGLEPTEVEQKAILLGFGYTSCPGICDGIVQRMASIIDAQPGVKAFFASIDPERDSPEKLGEYLKKFHPDIQGIHGSKEDMAALTKKLRVPYQKIAPLGEEGHKGHGGHEVHEEGQESHKGHAMMQGMEKSLHYDFLHSTRLFLFDQKGFLQDSYPDSEGLELVVMEIKEKLSL